MRRWAWRGCLTMVAMLVVLGSAVGARAFDRACDGSLEGLRYLTNARAQLATATAPPPRPPQPAPTPSQAQVAPAPPPPPEPSFAQRLLEVAGRAGDAAIVALIRVKQHDAVAYPAHIAAAHTLDLAGCSKDAVRLQWLKAGLHASDEGQIQYIASSLIQSADDPADLADLRRIVRTWTERAPLSISLRRVMAALDDHRS